MLKTKYRNTKTLGFILFTPLWKLDLVQADLLWRASWVTVCVNGENNNYRERDHIICNLSYKMFNNARRYTKPSRKWEYYWLNYYERKWSILRQNLVV